MIRGIASLHALTACGHDDAPAALARPERDLERAIGSLDARHESITRALDFPLVGF